MTSIPSRAWSSPVVLQNKRFAILVVALVLYIAVLFNYENLLAMGTQAVCAVSVLVGVCAAAFTALTANDGFWSVQSLYMFITAVFNLGLVLMVAIGRNVVNPLALLFTSWIYMPECGRAALMAALALLAFAIGSILTVRVRAANPPEEPFLVRDKVGFFACVLVCGSILGWTLYCLARAGSPHIFLASKGEFNEKTISPFIDFFYWGILMGMGLLFSTRHRYLKFTLIVFAIWGLDAFLLGQRGQVLFPVAAAVIVGSKTGQVKIKMGVLIIGLVAILSAISIVRDVRTYGAGHIYQSVDKASAADSLTELGGSLEATVMAMQFVH